MGVRGVEEERRTSGPPVEPKRDHDHPTLQQDYVHDHNEGEEDSLSPSHVQRDRRGEREKRVDERRTNTVKYYPLRVQTQNQDWKGTRWRFGDCRDSYRSITYPPTLRTVSVPNKVRNRPFLNLFGSNQRRQFRRSDEEIGASRRHTTDRTGEDYSTINVPTGPERNRTKLRPRFKSDDNDGFYRFIP